MLKIYCPKCGGLNTYVSEKPNFCQKCGGPLTASAAKAKQAVAQQQVEEEDDDDQESNLFDLDGLDIEIDSGRGNTETLGSLAGSVGENEVENLNESSKNMPKGRKKYTEADFRAEAGNLRDGGGNEAGST